LRISDVIVPITVGRDRSLKLVKEAYESDKTIGVVSQKKEGIENPDVKDLYEVGTVAQILKHIKMPDGSKSIVIHGQTTFKVDEFLQYEHFFKAKLDSYHQQMDDEAVELDACSRSIKEADS